MWDLVLNWLWVVPLGAFLFVVVWMAQSTRRYYRRYEGHIGRVEAINDEIAKSNRDLTEAIKQNTKVQRDLLAALKEQK